MAFRRQPIAEIRRRVAIDAAALTALCVEAGYIAYLHYATTAGEIMKKASVGGAAVETGAMLANPGARRLLELIRAERA